MNLRSKLKERYFIRLVLSGQEKTFISNLGHRKLTRDKLSEEALLANIISNTLY